MSGKRHWCRGYGLTIESTFAIPGSERIAPVPGRADIVISEGDTAFGPIDAIDGLYSRSGAALLFDAPSVARYFAPSAAELVIAPCVGADPELVSALLVATALPMLLWMRGGSVLHAAGVMLPGAPEAIALAGPSGVGKSTLAHRLVEAGARFVGDDSLLVATPGARPVVCGLPASCFLPEPSGDQREMRPIPASSQIESAPLGAVVILSREALGTNPSIERLHGPTALEVLLRNRHRPRIPTLLGRNAALLPVFAALSRAVPVYRLAMCGDDPAAAQVRVEALVEECSQGTGLVIAR